MMIQFHGLLRERGERNGGYWLGLFWLIFIIASSAESLILPCLPGTRTRILLSISNHPHFANPPLNVLRKRQTHRPRPLRQRRRR